MGVPLEAVAGLLQQFRRHGQVNLGVRQAGMPQVYGEVIHQPLHVRPLAIPLGQPMDREGMPEIVKPRLVATAVRAPDAGMFPQSLEGILHIPTVKRRPAPADEEVALGLGRRMRSAPPAGVLAEHLVQDRADGHQPRFEELGITNGEKGIRQIDVGDRQPPVPPRGATQLRTAATGLLAG